MADEEQLDAEQLDEEQLRERLDEELRKLRIQDVLVQTTFTLASLGFRRLGLCRGVERPAHARAVSG